MAIAAGRAGISRVPDTYQRTEQSGYSDLEAPSSTCARMLIRFPQARRFGPTEPVNRNQVANKKSTGDLLVCDNRWYVHHLSVGQIKHHAVAVAALD